MIKLILFDYYHKGLRTKNRIVFIFSLFKTILFKIYKIFEISNLIKLI